MSRMTSKKLNDKGDVFKETIVVVVVVPLPDDHFIIRNSIVVNATACVKSANKRLNDEQKLQI